MHSVHKSNITYLFSAASMNWKNSRRGQQMTRHYGTRMCTVNRINPRLELYVFGIRKIRQPVGSRHCGMWQRAVSSNPTIVIVHQIGMIGKVHPHSCTMSRRFVTSVLLFSGLCRSTPCVLYIFIFSMATCSSDSKLVGIVLCSDV